MLSQESTCASMKTKEHEPVTAILGQQLPGVCGQTAQIGELQIQ